MGPESFFELPAGLTTIPSCHLDDRYQPSSSHSPCRSCHLARSVPARTAPVPPWPSLPFPAPPSLPLPSARQRSVPPPRHASQVRRSAPGSIPGRLYARARAWCGSRSCSFGMSDGGDGDGGVACARDLRSSSDPDRTVNDAVSYAVRFLLPRLPSRKRSLCRCRRRRRCRVGGRSGGAQNGTAWNGCGRATESGTGTGSGSGSGSGNATMWKKRTRKRREVEAVSQLSINPGIRNLVSFGVPRGALSASLPALRSSSPQCWIVINSRGRSLASTGILLMATMVSNPLTTRPSTTCLPFK